MQAIYLALFVGMSAIPPIAVAKSQKADLANGIYEMKEKGDGVKVRRVDGTDVVLGSILTDSLGQAAQLRTIDNDNQRFQLDLKGVKGMPKFGHWALVLDGFVMAIASHSDHHPDGTMDIGVQAWSPEAAKAIEKHYQIEATRRIHPGHMLFTRFMPEKESYKVGEPIKLRMEIRNVGKSAVTFTVGGQQRGARDNQYRFIAQRGYGTGKSVPDTGDPTNFGGLGTWKELKPGEVFESTIDLDRWFKFTEPDSYRITGIFELDVVPPGDGFGRAIWEDFAVGQCVVYVEAAKGAASTDAPK
jgi:hypothetical protein